MKPLPLEEPDDLFEEPTEMEDEAALEEYETELEDRTTDEFGEYVYLLENDIANKDAESLISDLTYLTPSLDRAILDSIYQPTIYLALHTGWQKGAKILLKSWLKDRKIDEPADNPAEIICLAAYRGNFDLNTLGLMVNMWKDQVSLAILIEELITNKLIGSDARSLTALDKFWKVLIIKPTIDQLNSLLDIAAKELDTQTHGYLLDKKPSLLPPAPIPEWMIKPTSVETLPSQTVLFKRVADQDLKPLEFKTKQEFIDYLITSSPVKTPEVINAITTAINNFSESDLSRYMDKYIIETWILKLETNLLAKQVLGPANSDPNYLPEDPAAEDVFLHRMLTDETRDYDYENREYTPWFTGHCVQCYRPILKPCYAVRMPMPSGSWDGAYCSFTCIYDFLGKNQFYDKKMTSDIRELTEKVEKEIKRTGIYDRTYP